jgi:diguanylate cyclase (GGDEF)-like protein/putative nucleotidyltransferase with HDIG domain
VIGGLAVGSVGTAIVFQQVLNVTGGSRAAAATNLMYPLADLTLVGIVVWILAASGWRPGRAWGFLLGGLLVFSVSDCLYLFQTAEGSYEGGGATDLGWLAGGVLLAWAAWQPHGRERIGRDLDGLMVLLAPVGFGLLGLGVLVYDHVERVDLLSLVLATAAVVGVCARLGLTFAENLEMLGRTRTEARTDALTGLGNRRQLMDDLDAALERSSRGVLTIFDLNGFKLYNDLYGHPAGDALLARLGAELAKHAQGRGAAYRMGGDEFCLLVHASHEPLDEVVTAGAAALSARGEGFSITAAFGSVEFPAEAAYASEALRLADRRMYAEKNSTRGSASDQSMSVLLRAQGERDPQLAAHLRGVAELAETVAKALGLPDAQVREARLGAMLHDVGKMAIPDAILEKRGPLTEGEWRFLRSHTVIGERIIDGAPALAAIAPIVRSSHERFDGKGYPDGLAGEDIPVAARIVFVCDAFDAMITERAYAPAMPVDEALTELWRCAGTKFDPRIVSAFCAAIAGRRNAAAEETALAS